MTDLIRMKLSDFRKEEIADMEKYRAFAKDLEKDHPKAAGIIRDIADDEETHAKALEYILKM